MSELINLSDLTILIFVRLDTIECLANVLSVCRHLSSTFETNIWVLEYASNNNGLLKKLLDKNIRYSFNEDYDPVFYRTKHLNEIIKTVTTPFVAVWDTDVIIPGPQLEKAIEILRKGEADMVNPFRESFVDTVSVFKQLALQRAPIEEPNQELLPPDPCSLFDGAFIVSKKAYMDTIWANENLYDWETDNNKRYCRWINRGFKMQCIPGILFRLRNGNRRTIGKLILHFNTPEMTERLCQMVPGAIVIDNGSTQYPYRGKNRCIRQENLGFTKGWNQAIKTLWNEFDMFWLMNSDIVINRESVNRVEWIAGACPDIQFFTPTYNCWINYCQPHKNSGLSEAFVLEFTAPVISKQVFEKVGLFDELFALGYGVDFDFCYRVRQAGIRIYVDHRSCFYHLGHQTILKHEGIEQYDHDAILEMKAGLRCKYGSEYEHLVFKGIN